MMNGIGWFVKKVLLVCIETVKIRRWDFEFVYESLVDNYFLI